MSIELSNIYYAAYEYANNTAETLVNSRNSTIKFLKTNLPEEIVTKVSQLSLIIRDSDSAQLIREHGSSPSAIGVTLLGLFSGAYISERPLVASLALGSAFLLARTKAQFALLAGSALTGVAVKGAISLYGRANPIPLA